MRIGPKYRDTTWEDSMESFFPFPSKLEDFLGGIYSSNFCICLHALSAAALALSDMHEIG